MPASPRILFPALGALAGLLLVACSSDDSDGATPTPTVTTTESVTPTPEETEPGGEEGEPVPSIFDAEEPLGVVGVAHDDVLHLRAEPGAGAEVLAELTPLTQDLSARGDVRQVSDGGQWMLIDVPDVGEGWVNAAYIAALTGVEDGTVDLDLDRSAPDLHALASEIAEERLGSGLDIIVSQAPGGDGVMDLMIDAIGVADDSVLGERLHVFGEQAGDRFELSSVEVRTLCRRGVSGMSCI